MNILFISHYFPPEVNAPASRTFEHCRQWVKDGHQVTVLTAVPSHPKGVIYSGYKNQFQHEARDGIDIIRIRTYLSPNRGFIRRTLSYFSFMIGVILAIPKIPKTHIIISTSPQFFSGLSGYFVSRLKRTPWVLEIRDLWPDSILAVGAIKNKAIIGALKWLELFAYRSADYIVSVTDSFKRIMVEQGIESSKITVIKNGVDLNTFMRHPINKAMARELGVENKYVASYIGTLGMAHHLETILEAAALVKDLDIVFLIVGDGAERARLTALRDQQQLDNVIIADQMPRARMPSLLSITDVSLVLLKRSGLFLTVIPSKIFEAMAMRIPIILGVQGEAHSIIEAAQCGICIEPEDARALAKTVRKLYADTQLAKRLGENGRKHVEASFDRVKLAQHYETVLENVCGNKQAIAT